ncbi:MAG TPA: flagellar hook assembly protein FlgD [Gammaproteobacteria bacterium]|nr:flagellar hook assembly protein FlgD [Gammaproteobacteria bacterium]
MTEINTDMLQQYGLQNSTKKQKDPNAMMQDDFLTLMTEQLKNQDPMKPTDNGEFLGQMAQFSTVSSLSKLQETATSLADSIRSSMGLAAVGMIGKEALAKTDRVALAAEGEKINGVIDLPASSSKVQLTITDPGGNVIRTLNLGRQTAGKTEFSWDGKRTDGSPAAAGNYVINAEFATDGDETQAAATLVYSKIDSVSFDNGKATLNTRDGQSHELAAITQIH